MKKDGNMCLSLKEMELISKILKFVKDLNFEEDLNYTAGDEKLEQEDYTVLDEIIEKLDIELKNTIKQYDYIHDADGEEWKVSQLTTFNDIDIALLTHMTDIYRTKAVAMKELNGCKNGAWNYHTNYQWMQKLENEKENDQDDD